MPDYTPNKSSITSVQPGKIYNNVDELNYIDVTRRLVHLEQILSGKVDSNNAPTLPPIGAIIGWHKSLTNTPSLPSNWVECNGQTLSDVGSVYNGNVIPNLNGSASGADLSSGDNLGKTGDVFLRGDETSGATQLDNMQGHRHNVRYNTTDTSVVNILETDASIFGGVDAANGGATLATFGVGSPKADDTNGMPRTGAETRPRNMAVVWIMRIK